MSRYSLLNKIFCKHEYEKFGKDSIPIYTYYDYDGNKIGVFVCVCRKCGKMKKKKFY